MHWRSTKRTLDQTIPNVAIRLNNLASLLGNAKRLAEAEPLMRRHLGIFIDFERKTRHPHPHRDQAVANYADLLTALGKNEAEIKAAIASLLAADSASDPQ